MDNSKKQQQYQNHSRSGSTKTTSSQPTECNRQKPTADIQSNKLWPRNSRRRENASSSARNNNNNNNNGNNNSKQHPAAKVRPNVDKRPRTRGNGAGGGGGGGGGYRGCNNDNAAAGAGLVSVEATSRGPGTGTGTVARYAEQDYELNSVYAPGSKKQNLNHLLNFYYTPRENDFPESGGHVQRYAHAKKHRYNKEQFLQANFQFVVKASAKRKLDESPDTLVDWSLIEQINIQTPEEPQCPICLYPPVAAKVTRCGHVYCWPCLLHYLSLSDKTWRKCPICYESIHVADLKSSTIVQQYAFNVGDKITFQLMRRKKGSLFIEKYIPNDNTNAVEQQYPYMSCETEAKRFTKFLLARRIDIVGIIEREERELLADVDSTCPEYVYVRQALELLKDRSQKLGEVDIKDDTEEEPIEQDVAKREGEGKLENAENETLLADQQIPVTVDEAFNYPDSPITPTTPTASSSSAKYYYFYQSEDGQHIYLHPLNVKMLNSCYGSLADAPPIIQANILQKEHHSMDEERRRKFTCLGHLPLTCQFAVVEIDLQPPIVTEATLNAFKSDLLFRKKERQRRAREEREREKHINAINDRQMGKLIASTANINIGSSHEFPTCGFEEPLVANNDSSEHPVVSTSPPSSTGQSRKNGNSSNGGNCSYSAVAIHCYQELTPWATVNALQQKPRPLSEQSNDSGEISILDTLHTNLGDVLAQALSQKQKKSSTNEETSIGSNKKSKKNKKMLPLYSTGMNFSGN